MSDCACRTEERDGIKYRKSCTDHWVGSHLSFLHYGLGEHIECCDVPIMQSNIDCGLFTLDELKHALDVLDLDWHVEGYIHNEIIPRLRGDEDARSENH